jgi:predicted transcriptional regulator
MSEQNEELMALTASIVAAYVTRNSVPTTDLPLLIASTHAALAGLAGRPAPVVAEPLVPAVPIRRSVTPDAIICLEDGRSFKSLKRHLSASYGLTPDQYRAKWNLPADYPMVAPNYAEARSAMAKSIGLGRKTGPLSRRAKTTA